VFDGMNEEVERGSKIWLWHMWVRSYWVGNNEGPIIPKFLVRSGGI